MDSSTIIHDLKRRFSEPLPEFYKRRIIVWYDEEREFENILPEINIEGVEIAVLTGRNNFLIKKLISVDKPKTNILLYNPLSYEKPDDDWLLDVELYSEEFRADIIAIWMAEMHLPATPSMRQQVKSFRKYFNAKTRRDSITSQAKIPQTPVHLNLAVMSAIAGLKENQPGKILLRTLCAGLDGEQNKIYREFVNYGVDSAFWEMASQGTGYRSDKPVLAELFRHILLAAFACTYKGDIPEKLDVFSTERNRAFCYDIINNWIYSPEAETLRVYAKEAENRIGISDFFAKRPVDDLLNIECFPCVNEIILSKMMTAVTNDIIDIEKIRSIVEKRRVTAWYAEYESIYEGLCQMANMQEFYLNHSAGFHIAKAKDIWKTYTKDYYQMDQYYRHLHLHYEHSLTHYKKSLHDLYGMIIDKAEKLYNTWYLDELGTNWTTVAGDDLTKQGSIWDIPQQKDFYTHHIENAASRVFVVISDAMRYEVAEELYTDLQKESQSNVKISSQQAVFPTITKFGMAALLPNWKTQLTIQNGIVKVLVDGQSTDSSNRDAVLKRKNKDSIALKYNELITMKRADRSALAKGKQVIYIYHDTIDEASHVSDTAVFEACSDTVRELYNLVRVLVNDMGAINIILTSDHGFLYTYSSLQESDKLEKSAFRKNIIEYGRRYALMEKGVSPDYLLPVAMQTEPSEIQAFAAKGNVRIKSGGGMKFVHGGISLQEMVVPVIEFKHIKTGTKEYRRNQDKYDTKPVTVSLLTVNHMISNMTFKLEFYQAEPVSSNRREAEYMVYFIDSIGTIVSDAQKIIADKTSENAQNRIFTVGFSLKDMKFKASDSYYLVIADADGMEVHREEFEFVIAYEDETKADEDYFS